MFALVARARKRANTRFAPTAGMGLKTGGAGGGGGCIVSATCCAAGFETPLMIVTLACRHPPYFDWLRLDFCTMEEA